MSPRSALKSLSRFSLSLSCNCFGVEDFSIVVCSKKKKRFLGCSLRNADKGSSLRGTDFDTWVFLESGFQVKEKERNWAFVLSFLLRFEKRGM